MVGAYEGYIIILGPNLTVHPPMLSSFSGSVFTTSNLPQISLKILSLVLNISRSTVKAYSPVSFFFNFSIASFKLFLQAEKQNHLSK